MAEVLIQPCRKLAELPSSWKYICTYKCVTMSITTCHRSGIFLHYKTQNLSADQQDLQDPISRTMLRSRWSACLWICIDSRSVIRQIKLKLIYLPTNYFFSFTNFNTHTFSALGKFREYMSKPFLRKLDIITWSSKWRQFLSQK